MCALGLLAKKQRASRFAGRARGCAKGRSLTRRPRRRPRPPFAHRAASLEHTRRLQSLHHGQMRPVPKRGASAPRRCPILSLRCPELGLLASNRTDFKPDAVFALVNDLRNPASYWYDEENANPLANLGTWTLVRADWTSSAQAGGAG